MKVEVSFFDKFDQNVVDFSNKIALRDEATSKGISFGQLEQLSGKVYSYLHSKGIGKEDFVMICLPRGVQPIIAIHGVWKNGSAFVLVEDNYAPERIQYIKENCNCKLVIDSEVWKEIQYCDYKAGREKVEPHDAAFAIYTSGTTGNPKGVIHEFGNLDYMVASTVPDADHQLTEPDDRFALPAPLNFIASVLIIVYGAYWAATLYVISYATIKSPINIGLFMLKNKINGTFLTPTYIKSMKAKPASLRFCIIGSEPAHNVYMEGLTIHNFYLMSESGFALTHFIIDKEYDDTPVGRPDFDLDIKLVDEEGNEVADGQEGEVIFENPYVRGYVNLPEETSKVFRDGYYHTGDLAFKDEQGRFVICGRLNDMAKINGNRVEPGEIEGVAKKVLGIDWAAAKIVDDGRQVYICVYYLDKKLKVDFEKTREAMSQYLPYYMLPSYFIKIDEIPLRPTGKMDRKALPNPVMDNYLADYVAPRDELETALCEAFQKVLSIDKIGINDDFYQLGGDSMGSMEILVESDVKGLTTADIFAGHTPERIAAIYRKKHPHGVDESDDEIDDKSKEKEHHLTPFQVYMFDYQLYTPKSTMFNLYNMMRFAKEKLDIHKMVDVLYEVIKAHPALCTQFSFNLDGEVIQTYHPEIAKKVEIEKITEWDMDILKDTLVQPFKLIRSPLYRLRMFETEKYGYIFFDVHHTISDGTSFQIIMQDIIKTYYDMELDRDYYYKILHDEEAIKNTPQYLEDKAYFESVYEMHEEFDQISWREMFNTQFSSMLYQLNKVVPGHHLKNRVSSDHYMEEYSGRPVLDHEVRDNKLDTLYVPLEDIAVDLLAVEEKYGVSRNAYFGLVTMMAISVYNRTPNIQISWTYNGRDDLQKMSTVGLLLRDLPLAEKFSKNQRITELFKSVQEQVAKGIAHSSYPYTLTDYQVVSDDTVCFLYQENLRDEGAMSELGIEMIEVEHNRAASENILDVEILDGEDGLMIMMDYAASCYEKSSMERFAGLYVGLAKALLETVRNDKLTLVDAVKHTQKLMNEKQLIITWLQK